MLMALFKLFEALFFLGVMPFVDHSRSKSNVLNWAVFVSLLSSPGPKWPVSSKKGHTWEVPKRHLCVRRNAE